MRTISKLFIVFLCGMVLLEANRRYTSRTYLPQINEPLVLDFILIGNYKEITIEHMNKGAVLYQLINGEPIVYTFDIAFSHNKTHIRMELPSFDPTFHGIIHSRTRMAADKFSDEYISIEKGYSVLQQIRELVTYSNFTDCCIEGGNSRRCAESFCFSERSLTKSLIDESSLVDCENPRGTFECSNKMANIGSSVACCRDYGMPLDPCLELCKSDPNYSTFSPDQLAQCQKYSKIVYSCKSIFQNEPEMSIRSHTINTGSSFLVYWSYERSYYTNAYSILLNDQLLYMNDRIKPWTVVEFSEPILIKLKISADTIYGSTPFFNDRTKRNEITLTLDDRIIDARTVQPTSNVTECCNGKEIPEECQKHLCSGSFPANIHSDWLYAGKCLSYVPKALNCQYAIKDSSSCCTRNNIKFPCNRLCSNMEDASYIGPEDIQCLIDNLNILSQCLIRTEDETTEESGEDNSQDKLNELLALKASPDAEISVSGYILMKGIPVINGNEVEWREEYSDLTSKPFKDLQEQLCHSILFRKVKFLTIISCLLLKVEEAPFTVSLHQLFSFPVLEYEEGDTLIESFYEEFYRNFTKVHIEKLKMNVEYLSLGRPANKSEILSYSWRNSSFINLSLNSRNTGSFNQMIYINSKLLTINDGSNENLLIGNMAESRSFNITIQNVNNFGFSEPTFLRVEPRDNLRSYQKILRYTTIGLSVTLVLLIILFTVMSIHFTKYGYPISLVSSPGKKIMTSYAKLFNISPVMNDEKRRQHKGQFTRISAFENDQLL